MPATSRSIFTDTVAAAATITEGQAVTVAGAVASSAGNAIGIACTDAVSGEQLAVDMIGTAVAIAGAAVAKGAALEVGSAGKLVTQSAGVTVARALQAAGADGDRFEVFLIAN